MTKEQQQLYEAFRKQGGKPSSELEEMFRRAGMPLPERTGVDMLGAKDKFQLALDDLQIRLMRLRGLSRRR